MKEVISYASQNVFGHHLDGDLIIDVFFQSEIFNLARLKTTLEACINCRFDIPGCPSQ
jgi:hypothetical protein